MVGALYQETQAGDDKRSVVREFPGESSEEIRMASIAIQPYLVFGGRCDEALAFYQKSLGATIDMVMRFDESPVPTPPGILQPGFEKKVMHTTFRVGNAVVMATDGCDDKATFSGFSLALSYTTEEEVKKAFDALSEGGKVGMPLCQTFWSPLFGMVTDKFGVGWMVSVPGDLPKA